MFIRGFFFLQFESPSFRRMNKVSQIFRLPEIINESTEENFSYPSNRKDTWGQIVRILEIFFPTPDNAKMDAKKDAKLENWFSSFGIVLFCNFQSNSNGFIMFYHVLSHFSCLIRFSLSDIRHILARCREALSLWRCRPRWWWTPTQPEEVSDLDPKESASEIKSLAKWSWMPHSYYVFSRMRSEGFSFYTLGVWGWRCVRWMPLLCSQPSATVCNRLQPSATVCHRPQPSASGCLAESWLCL